jgi:hypothetical protein
MENSISLLRTTHHTSEHPQIISCKASIDLLEHAVSYFTQDYTIRSQPTPATFRSQPGKGWG